MTVISNLIFRRVWLQNFFILLKSQGGGRESGTCEGPPTLPSPNLERARAWCLTEAVQVLNLYLQASKLN